MYVVDEGRGEKRKDWCHAPDRRNALRKKDIKEYAWWWGYPWSTRCFCMPAFLTPSNIRLMCTHIHAHGDRLLNRPLGTLSIAYSQPASCLRSCAPSLLRGQFADHIRTVRAGCESTCLQQKREMRERRRAVPTNRNRHSQIALIKYYSKWQKCFCVIPTCF